MMGTSCILVTARVHHWFKGRDGFVSNFILSKIVAQQVIILLSENKLSFLCVAKKAMINFVSFSCVQIFCKQPLSQTSEPHLWVNLRWMLTQHGIHFRQLELTVKSCRSCYYFNLAYDKGKLHFKCCSLVFLCCENLQEIWPHVSKVDHEKRMSSPWWKTLQDLLRSLKILKDLQRSSKTRFFQGSLKDPAQILKDPWQLSKILQF